METNPDKRARREKALQDGHLGFHGTNIEFDANTKLKPFAGTSKAFDGVSIARDKEIAIGYALRSLIQKQSGLEFRKGFEVNWNSTTKKYVLSIEGKSKDQVLAMLKNFKQTDFFIYELAKQEDRWGGVRNKNFGLFEMATNQTDTEWLTREKISLWDLINHGDMEIEGVSKNMNSTNPDYFGKEARIYTTIDAQQAHRNSQFMDNAFEGIYHKSANEVVLLVNELREEIGRQYKHATGKDLHLTSEQLVSVYEAHSQSGKLGELSL